MKKLLIPFCIEAFLSNGKTSDEKRVPVLAPDYKKVSYTSFLGSQNTPGIFQTSSVLKAGAHLHFILPDAFTHAGENGYLAVPNRYLVTRMYTDSHAEQVFTKCFLVESDFMSLDHRYADSITIPRFQEKDLRKNWRYLGRSYALDNKPEPTCEEEYLEKLTAIGAGDPMFASYYPSCSSVFGFYDNLQDVPLNTSLTYFVAGYYDSSSKDPFYGIKTKEDFEKVLAAMDFSVTTKDVCDSCLLFGEISGVFWKGTQEEYDQEPVGEIQVTVGNTSAEALSAALVRMVDGTEEDERLLTALQYDLEDCANQADGNYQMDDEIYMRQFHRLDGEEQRQELVFCVKEQKPLAEDTLDVKEEPVALGKLFSDYSCAREEQARMERELNTLQNRLYSTWEQYLLCYENPRKTPKNIPSKEEMLREILRICTEDIQELQKQIRIQEMHISQYQTELNAQMKEDAKVVKTAGDPFYAPKDPVLLFGGPGMKRVYAFGEDGRFTKDGTLMCQTDVLESAIKQENLFACLQDQSILEQAPDFYPPLWYQAVLLSSDCQALLEQKFGGPVQVENLPSPVARNRYHKESITLFLQWSVKYLPINDQFTPQNWEYEENETNYHYRGALEPSQFNPEFFTGRILLTPHAVLHLSGKLKKWLQEHPDDFQMEKLAEKIKNLGVVSQNLDGFTKAMLMLKQTYQFPIVGAGGDEAAEEAVREYALTERMSVIPEGQLRHLRMGMFGIHKLNLVGTFGQVQKVCDSSYYGEKEIAYAQTLEQVGNYAVLPPAFCQPVRVSMKFVSAKDDNVVSSAAPETSPVYGILMPELINRRLMVYQADGTFLGSVNTAYENSKIVAKWVDAKFPERPFIETQIEDERLRKVVEGLLKTEGALQDMLGLMELYYEKKLIPHTERQIWGRSFVLARLKVQLEFWGMPEFDKNLTAFGTYHTKDAEKIKVPLYFGDLERATDGVLGCFEEDVYQKFCPAYGTSLRQEEAYFLPANQVQVSAQSGIKYLTLLMADHANVTMQTGLLPAQTIALPGVHATATDHLLAALEMNPVLGGAEHLFIPTSDYTWRYRIGEQWIQSEKSDTPMGFGESVIMDGFLVKEEQ